MRIKIYISSKQNKYEASGVYDDGKVIVFEGGKINQNFARHILGGTAAKKIRDDNEYVDGVGNIIKQCEFSSLSTAAQFVTGRSCNGYKTWKTEQKKTIGEYLKEKGLR